MGSSPRDGLIHLRRDRRYTSMPILHTESPQEHDYRMAIYALQYQLDNARTELAVLNDTLHTRIETLELQVNACRSSEQFMADEVVRTLQRDERGIAKLPWYPKTPFGMRYHHLFALAPAVVPLRPFPYILTRGG